MMDETTRRNPKVSILLPTHNRADVLPFAIRSVLGQTVQDFELLIVGDGCTDGTAEIVEAFSDPRIVWFDLPKAPGFGYANRNVALRQADGAYIAFMAHDDLWLPDHLELLLPCLEQPGIELAYSHPLWITPDGKIAPSVFNLHNASELEMFLAKKINRIPAGCVIHRRECLDKYGYWNDNLPNCADWDMWIRIIEGGGKKNFVYLPKATCLHFRADWRKKLNTVLEHEMVWEQFYALDGFMPGAMKIEVPDGMTEQEAAWQIMSMEPLVWAKDIREAIREAFDQRVDHSDRLMAWMRKRWPALTSFNSTNLIEHISRIIERKNFLETEVVHLTNQNATLIKRQAKLEASTTSPETSLAWKLTRTLQSIKQHIIPFGTWREKLWLRITQNLRK